jgi:hypothetical protein
MVALHIEDEETYRLAKELAERNNTDIAAEVLLALRERKARFGGDPPDLYERIIALSEETSRFFRGEDRTRDLTEDLYDEYGLPK